MKSFFNDILNSFHGFFSVSHFALYVIIRPIIGYAIFGCLRRLPVLHQIVVQHLKVNSSS